MSRAPLLGKSESGATQRREDDCLPAAVATVLSVPLDLLPDVDHDSTDWIGDYNRALRAGGWPFTLVTASPDPVLDGRWIAVVPSLTQPAPTKHAVVMDGHRLLWDVGRKAKYQTVEPEQVKCAIYVVATGSIVGVERRMTLEHGVDAGADDLANRDLAPERVALREDFGHDAEPIVGTAVEPNGDRAADPVGGGDD